MSKIDPTARIEDGAVIGEGAEIGPRRLCRGYGVPKKARALPRTSETLALQRCNAMVAAS